MKTKEPPDPPIDTIPVRYVIPASLPEPGAPSSMGDWPPDIAEEARRRGAWPVIQIIWTDDLQAMTASKATRVALEVAQAKAVHDPVVTAIAERVIAHLPPASPGPAKADGPFLMRVDDYARRLSYSTGTIDRLIRKGLPILGRHKGRRVVVDKADRWIEDNLDLLNLDDSDDLEVLATKNAKKLGGAKP